MNYLLLMYLPTLPADAPDATDETVLSCAQPVVDRAVEKGQFVAAGVLRPALTATSVRLRDGQMLVTDGPFAETREVLAGYLQIEAANLDEAIATAFDHPAAREGTVEIRPVMPVHPRERVALARS